MNNEIVLRPAKRVVVLSAIGIAILVVLIGFGLFYLYFFFQLDLTAVSYIWLGSLIIGALVLLYTYLWRLTSVFKISNESVTTSTGILAKEDVRISLNRIVDYRLMRTMLDRILGLGSLHINTAGNDQEIIMQQLSDTKIDVATKTLNNLLQKEPLDEKDTDLDGT